MKQLNFSYQNLRSLLLGFLLSLGIFAFVAPTASALPMPDVPVTNFAVECKDIRSASDKEDGTTSGSQCIYQKYINPFVQFLAAIAGLAITIAIVIGGIKYSSAGGDPGKVASAKNMISKAIIALLAFLFLAAFLNWLTPGGLTGRG